MVRLKVVWYDRKISIVTMLKLLQTLVIPLFLYACETWTLMSDIQRGISALEMKYYCKILRILYTDWVSNV